MDKSQFKQIARIANTDVNGALPVQHSLTKIQGISFSLANAICNTLNIDKKTKIGDLAIDEIKKIEDVINFPSKYNLPSWLLNRRKDYETGEDKHLITSKLKFEKDNDIKIMKKIKTYKGMRHAYGLPVRGQRTRSNFRHGAALGVQKKKVKMAAPAPEKGKGKK